MGVTVQVRAFAQCGELLVGVQEGVGGVFGEILVVGGYTGTEAGILGQKSRCDDDELIRMGRGRRRGDDITCNGTRSHVKDQRLSRLSEYRDRKVNFRLVDL